MPNGSLDYTMGHLKADVETLQSDVKMIKAEMRELAVWRWKVVGAVSVLALAGNSIFDIVKSNLI